MNTTSADTFWPVIYRVVGSVVFVTVVILMCVTSKQGCKGEMFGFVHRGTGCAAERIKFKPKDSKKNPTINYLKLHIKLILMLCCAHSLSWSWEDELTSFHLCYPGKPRKTTKPSQELYTHIYDNDVWWRSSCLKCCKISLWSPVYYNQHILLMCELSLATISYLNTLNLLASHWCVLPCTQFSIFWIPVNQIKL